MPALSRCFPMKPNLLARLDTLESEARAGKIPSTDDHGQPTWIEGREAIHIMCEMLRNARAIRQGKDYQLVLSDYPKDLQRKIRLWSRSEPGEGDGQISHLVKTMCLEVMARET